MIDACDLMEPPPARDPREYNYPFMCRIADIAEEMHQICTEAMIDRPPDFQIRCTVEMLRKMCDAIVAPRCEGWRRDKKGNMLVQLNDLLKMLEPAKKIRHEAPSKKEE